MGWTAKEIEQYHTFAKQYISTYGERIDCADLGISALIDFAAKNKLPVRLKYFQGRPFNSVIYTEIVRDGNVATESADCG